MEEQILKLKLLFSLIIMICISFNSLGQVSNENNLMEIHIMNPGKNYFETDQVNLVIKNKSKRRLWFVVEQQIKKRDGWVTFIPNITIPKSEILRFEGLKANAEVIVKYQLKWTKTGLSWRNSSINIFNHKYRFLVEFNNSQATKVGESFSEEFELYPQKQDDR